MLIQIPTQHIIDISIEKLIADTTQLNELILLASKKLNRIKEMESYKIINPKKNRNEL